MILIFGGTTEGRTAVKVLDEAGSPYYYSTRGNAQQIECKHGTRVAGGMDCDAMTEFCSTHNIRLIIDAAHPFASLLHTTVATVSEQLDLPVIRLERRYPPRDESLVWCDTFDDAIDYLESHEIRDLLALSGVQTITKLQRYWKKHPCHFRVLDRDDSREIARRTGFPAENLLFWQEGQDELTLFRQLRPGAILTKESGESGYYEEKITAARQLGIPVIVIRRPSLPDSFYVVNGEHGLRYRVERLLPGFYPLRSGFTTGSCATAATRAALEGLLSRIPQHSATITLPDGETVTLPVSSCTFTKDSCTCGVIKDAGDDPDVTNGYTVLSTVSLTTQPGVQFLPGEGVGTITLPGTGIPVGEPAINQTPRRMITNEIEQLLHSHGLHSGVSIRISVPGGSELAQKTFNPRLGIIGGISIIGTSGIVRPFSSEAFVNSIRKEIQVARALGCTRIVINSGAKSENYLRSRFPDLPAQAFIHYGNYIGDTLRLADEEGITHITMGIMIGKAVKLAEGHLDTHSRNVVMNRDFITSLAAESHCHPANIARVAEITLARELWELFTDTPAFFTLLVDRCMTVCRPLLSHATLEIMLVPEQA
ncbi:cobalt-precorrin-5B (C(1))-methyltransferase [Butyricimonas virosa]|uniref:Cobalt-precorrin-5B C(1)-methyltransferase n=1 Tax=Butyricimonas virosa TaxID=544645 RepID=A0A413IHZ3_9BACT|nr:cobalt-precorrin-5B (C(1))-methyltransferase CbiD [Butyricimonas virosa]RGY11602.1 cobalt-precorrin-5B (C(1))-methyltransferase [Butyricimonas virosa]RHI14796.1 cobalt-precorrin-5B (C(1))-methyltransferase [Butyricimonas virosa]